MANTNYRGNGDISGPATTANVARNASRPMSVSDLFGNAARPSSGPTTRTVPTTTVRVNTASRVSPAPGLPITWDQFTDFRDDPASGSFNADPIPGPNGYTVANKDQSRLTPSATAFADTPLTNPGVSAISDALRPRAVGVPGHGQTAFGRMPIDNSVPLNMPQPAGGMQPPMGQPQQAMTRQQQRRAMIAARQPYYANDGAMLADLNRKRAAGLVTEDASKAILRGRGGYMNYGGSNRGSGPSYGAMMPTRSIGGAIRNTYGD